MGTALFAAIRLVALLAAAWVRLNPRRWSFLLAGLVAAVAAVAVNHPRPMSTSALSVRCPTCITHVGGAGQDAVLSGGGVQHGAGDRGNLRGECGSSAQRSAGPVDTPYDVLDVGLFERHGNRLRFGRGAG
jgi:hypothetical protein